MKKNKFLSFIIRLIEGQTTAIESFIFFLAILAISVGIIYIGNHI
jgi:hypothetical protein